MNMQFLIQKFREPSTYAGVGVLLAAFGIPLAEGLWQHIVQMGIAGASIAAILMSEKPKTPGE